MSSVIFWNVNKKDLTTLVCLLTHETRADAVVLIENSVPNTKILDELQKNVSADFFIPRPASEKRFHCFCRNPVLDMSEVHSGLRTSVRKYRIGSRLLLMALVHGVDIRNYDAETRQSFIQELATDLKLVKEQQNSDKLFLLGDFNMNPYDRGMNLAAGLNAMMTRTCVARGYRHHLGKDYDFYYNPMWSLFGDNTHGPAGTIYDTSNQGPYGWSIFDQVVIHHSIICCFQDVEILTKAGAHSLMDANGHPDKENASDHFPILVRFFGGDNDKFLA